MAAMANISLNSTLIKAKGVQFCSLLGRKWWKWAKNVEIFDYLCIIY